MSAAEGTGEQAGAEVLPDRPDALVEEINRTREELGNTVEALAAKVDVKARAQQKAAEVSGQLKSKLQDATQGLSGKAGQLRGEASGRTAGGTAQSAAARAQSAATQAGATAQSAAAQAGRTAWAATPEPVQQRARKAAAIVNEHQVPFAAATAAGALVLGSWLVVRGLRR
ncbi:MAG TPA: DUF3618 domain-containing protein [Streptosporangiaceae bacterium]|jgi:cobalamin biosynthesis Mg chelatase CobN